MKYKAILSDFDDTLLRDDNTVSEFTINAIKNYQEAGGFFGVCSGRMTRSALARVREMGLSGYVMAYQGGTLCDIKTGELLIEERMTCEETLAVLKDVEKLRFNKYQIFNGEEYITKVDNPYVKDYAKAVNIEPTLTVENLRDYVDKRNISANKILVYIHPWQAKFLIRKFSRKFPNLHFVCSKKFFLEITSNRATKGGMASEICKRFGIKQSEMICVGDSLNDITMIKYAGLGACVENGRSEVKKIADKIIPSNNEDGVGKLVDDALNDRL